MNPLFKRLTVRLPPTDKLVLVSLCGADITDRIVVVTVMQSGLTPLHLAAQEDKVNVAEVLLNHGADVNPQTKVQLFQMHTHCVYTHTHLSDKHRLCRT